VVAYTHKVINGYFSASWAKKSVLISYGYLPNRF